MAEPKTVQIRDMDPDLWAKLKAQAALRKTTVQAIIAQLVTTFVNDSQ